MYQPGQIIKAIHKIAFTTIAGELYWTHPDQVLLVLEDNSTTSTSINFDSNLEFLCLTCHGELIRRAGNLESWFTVISCKT
jgi:hypothetical protein